MLDPHRTRLYSYINTASSIIQSYQGEIPFAYFIKKYFSHHKKHGSKDRKFIMQLCYAYFRLGKSFSQLSITQKILKGLQYSHSSIDENWEIILKESNLPKGAPDHIFDFNIPLSEGIDVAAFERSHLIQPDLFLRIRPGMNKIVMDKLQSAGARYEIDGNTIRLPNSFRADNIISINKEAVVQDLNSQKVADLLHLFNTLIPSGDREISIWDCCAASGGKSILAKDLIPQANLIVSDLRPSILANLKQRFREAGIQQYKAFVADASTAAPSQLFDLVIADVPCSGSGTWARTPEYLLFFEEQRLKTYVNLQSAIVSNVIHYIKPKGYLLYITCSVFKKENEDQIQILLQKGWQLIKQNVFNGYENKADNMYAALLKKQ